MGQVRFDTLIKMIKYDYMLFLISTTLYNENNDGNDFRALTLNIL